MSLKKNILWNLFGSITPMLVGIVAIPYIYNEIGIERIGILTIIWSLIGYFSIFDFGLGRSITQRIASLSSLHLKGQIIKVATTGVFMTLAIGFFVGLVGLIANKITGVSWINSPDNLKQEIYLSFTLAWLTVPATTVTAGLRGILEGEQRFKEINLLKLALGLSNFLSPIASIIFFGPRLDYIVGSLTITRYVILIAHYLIVRSKIENNMTKVDFEELKQLFRFGGWMTLSNIISPLMVVADRFLVAKILGTAAVAFYTIPSEFMIKLLLLPAAITTTLFPTFSKNLAQKNHSSSFAVYKKSLKIIFLVMGSIALCIFISADLGLRLWLGAEFADKSAKVVTILAFGILFNSLAQVPYAYIQASGDARSTALIHLLELILYIPTLFYLIQMEGIAGAAFAWMLRALIDLVLLHFRVLRINK